MLSFFRKTPSISITELSKKLTKPIILLDVRTPQEYQLGHIKQAKNALLTEIGRYSGQDSKVYVICQSGMRSRQETKILNKKGFDVTNVRGGMSQWTGYTVGGMK